MKNLQYTGKLYALTFRRIINEVYEKAAVLHADDADNAVRLLQRQDWIESVYSTPGRYDFGKLTFNRLPPRLYNITGKIKL